jgi:hypothetical protein
MMQKFFRPYNFQAICFEGIILTMDACKFIEEELVKQKYKTIKLKACFSTNENMEQVSLYCIRFNVY